MFVCMYNGADACISDTGHWRRVAKGQQRTAGRCRPLQPLPIRCTSIRCNGASTAKPLTFARSTPPTRRLNASPRTHGNLVFSVRNSSISQAYQRQSFRACVGTGWVLVWV